LPKSFRVCYHSPVLVHLALVIDLVIHRTSFQLSLHFLPTILEILGNYVTALQDAARPGVTRTLVRSSKLAFRVIKILMEHIPIALHWDASSLTIADSDATFPTCANVVIDRVEPVIGMFVESCDEDRFFGSLIRVKFVAP
jgi:hypothetical protein